MAHENMEKVEIIKNVRARASSMRAFAKFSIFGIVIIVSAMIIFFTMSSDLYLTPGTGISLLGTGDEMKPSELLASEQKQTIEAIKLLESEIEKVRDEISNQKDFQEGVLMSISLSVIRLASVFLAVYLIQILVGFTRYHFRMADHLDSTADAFELTNGDPDKLGSVLSSISPQHIEFGKLPTTLTEHSTELIKELVKKIPGK